MYKEILKYQRIYLSSHVIYGSSRLGTKDYLPGQIYSLVDYTQAQPVADTVNLLGRRPWYSNEYQDDIIYTHTEPWQATQTGMFSAGERIGEKQYELTNHLGNVMATVSDNKVGIYNGNGNLELAGWHPALRAAYDYYPFGMLMPDRYISDTTQHCVTVSQPHWAWKLVLIGCVDQYKWVWPKSQLFGSAQASVGDNGVLLTALNPGDGMSFELSVTPNVENEIHFEINRLDMAKNASIQILETNGSEQTVLAAVPIKDAEGLVIPFTPHSGKVKFVLLGPIKVWVRRICAWHMDWVEEDQLVTICDGDKDKYRFGYQGQEKDNELKGIGNSLNYTYRMHDPRIGRFFAIDPLTSKYPYYSPYAFSGNRVIDAVELEGLEPASRGNVGVYMGLKASGMTDKDAQRFVNGMVQAEQRAIAPMVEGTLDATPIDDIYGVVFGRHLLRKEEYNRGEATAWAAATFIPFGKVVKTGGKFILKGFVKTELKWDSKVFKNVDDFREAVKDAPNRVNAYKEAGKQVAEKNGWTFNRSLSKKNKDKFGRNRKIYSNKKGMHFSLDTKTGSFEVHNKQRKHQGEINFDGERLEIGDASKKHDLNVK